MAKTSFTIHIRSPREISDLLIPPVPFRGETRSNICTRANRKNEPPDILRKPCHIELSTDDKGPVLRVCGSWNNKNEDAQIIRVRNHVEANKISHAICQCQNEGRSATECVRGVTTAKPRSARSRSRK